MNKLMTLSVMAALLAAPVMVGAPRADDINKIRTEILQTRYNSELKAATPANRAKVVAKYSEQLNPNRLTPKDYSKLPVDQRYKYGTGAMNDVTAKPEGTSTYAASRKKAEKDRANMETNLNYYDLPGSASSPSLLPQR